MRPRRPSLRRERAPTCHASSTKKMNKTNVSAAGQSLVMNDWAPPVTVVTVVLMPPVTEIVGIGVTAASPASRRDYMRPRPPRRRSAPMPILHANSTKKMNKTNVIRAGHALVMKLWPPAVTVVIVDPTPDVTSIVGTGVTERLLD